MRLSYERLPEMVKYRTLSEDVLLGAVETNAKHRIQIKDKGKWFTRVRFSSLLGSMEILRLTLRKLEQD